MSTKVIQSVKNWQGFVDALDPLGKKQRGNAFELLTELLLQIDPIYRTKLKHVWHESSLPSTVRQKLNLPSPDIGVDLVAEDTSGEYWGIQCKYHHDPTKNLTKNELNSFLDLTTRVCRGKFKTLLAVTSGHGYSINLQKHAPEVQYVLSDVFQSLDEDFFRQARLLMDKQTPTLKKRIPRPHQQVAIKNAIQHFVIDGESRGKLIHPCGTGKSLIGYWVADALDAASIVVALPSLYLVRQTLADWTKESLALQKQMGWMVVCSEATIGESGDPAMRFQEIGVDVTTDVDRVAEFLAQPDDAQKVIFTTYQSGHVTAEAARKAGCVFDVGIFDEAHRTVGQKGSLFSHLIFDKNIKIRRRVFMTATERRYQGSSETILSMDDVEAYGETFDMMTFKEALEQENPILCDYKIVTMVIGRSEIEQLIDQNLLVKPDKGKWDDETEARTLAALIALRKVMRTHGANHALTFHNSIAKAKAFQQSQRRFNGVIEGYANVDCFHVSSKVATGVRKAELDRFRDSRKALVTNARCLTEGIDIPTIDAVLFADTKRSTIDIVQAAGRALRPAVGKRMGYIVVPVLVDENDPAAIDKAFQDVLMTLRAMASNDERIIDYFRSISEGERPSRSDSIVEFDVPDPIRVKLDNFVESIETQTWHRLAKLSWRPFEEAREVCRSLELTSMREWGDYCRGRLDDRDAKPADIPSNPSAVYANKGWVNWGDWLGTFSPSYSSKTFMPFGQAKTFARSVGLRSKAEYESFIRGELSDKPKVPPDLPYVPSATYKNTGWRGWGDFLGTGRQRRRGGFRSFAEARKFVHDLRLDGMKEWRSWCNGRLPDRPKKPQDIPTTPHEVYKNAGWKSWVDWLGVSRPEKGGMQSFAKARAFARKLGLKSKTEWQRYCSGQIADLPNKPIDIPANPEATYRSAGWKSWGDWLGTETVAPQNREYRLFRDARDFAHSMGLDSRAEWRSYCKGEIQGKPSKPDDIPAAPNNVYKKKGWLGWGDWLGTGYRRESWRSFAEARRFVQRLGLQSSAEWKEYAKDKLDHLPPKPDDIPVTPNNVYRKKGWISWPDWLGKD